MINQETVAHIAKLSRLGFTESESRLYAEHLGQILNYVAQLAELDTAGVEPSLHALSVLNVFREDHVRHSLSKDQIFANAPEMESTYFKIPQMMGGN